MAGTTRGRRLPRRRALRLERAARHLLQAYQRTYSDDGVWEQEVDELHLDYVIALEALMTSPNDKHEGISERVRSRAAALFLPPSLRQQVETVVQEAYSARFKYDGTRRSPCLRAALAAHLGRLSPGSRGAVRAAVPVRSVGGVHVGMAAVLLPAQAGASATGLGGKRVEADGGGPASPFRAGGAAGQEVKETCL